MDAGSNWRSWQTSHTHAGVLGTLIRVSPYWRTYVVRRRSICPMRQAGQMKWSSIDIVSRILPASLCRSVHRRWRQRIAYQSITVMRNDAPIRWRPIANPCLPNNQTAIQRPEDVTVVALVSIISEHEEV